MDAPLNLSGTPSTPPTYRFDRLFLRRLGRLLRLLFRSTPGVAPFYTLHKDARQQSIFWLYMVFFFLSCGSEWLIYYVGLIPSRFYGLLMARDQAGFLLFMAPCLLLIFGVAAVSTKYAYFCVLLSLNLPLPSSPFLMARDGRLYISQVDYWP
jgi:ATP-binding cassette subfamily D (ALD) protein 4